MVTHSFSQVSRSSPSLDHIRRAALNLWRLVSMGGLIAVVMLSGRAASSVNQLSLLMLRFQQTRSAVEGLSRSWTYRKKNQAPSDRQGDFAGGVRLDEVTFYPDTQSPALKRFLLILSRASELVLSVPGRCWNHTFIDCENRPVLLPTTGKLLQRLTGNYSLQSVFTASSGIGCWTNH